MSIEPRSAFDVVRIGPGRVRIRGGVPGEAAPEHLISWLTARSEVREVCYRDETGTLEVHFDAANGAGAAFIRSLRDHIFVTQKPEPESPSHQVVHSLAGRARLRVTGMSDESLERLGAWLETKDGIVRARPSPASESLVVHFDGARTNAAKVLAAVEASDPRDWPDAVRAPHRPTGWKTAAFNTAVFAVAVSGVAPPLAVAGAVGLTAIPSVQRAIRAAKEKRASVDVLDLAAIGISLATGQPVTASFITWLLGIGDLVLERTQDGARTAISKLMRLDASFAFRVNGDKVEKVPVRKLAVGDRLVVEAGGQIAADGVVLSGVALVDEKALTGESVPRERRCGDRVLAASVVVEGQIVLEVDRAGIDTTAMKIVQILEGAGAKPMTLQRDTERVADKLVLPTFAVAGAAAFFASQIDRMTSVLITDFGTGIRIAVPTAALTAMTVAAREGVLVKGGQYLERMAKTDVIVFDKTGTLTGGSPHIVDVVAVGDMNAREAMTFAAAAEERQRHPIAEAILHRAKHDGLPRLSAELGSESYTIGVGLAACVEGRAVLVGGRRLMQQHGIAIGHAHPLAEGHKQRGASTLYVAVDGELVLVLAFADEPRPESRAVVEALKANGRREVILLSGDASGPVAAVGRAVGVDRALGELLPEDKAAYVRELRRAGKTVAMVGDGINDAPALAVADVGISLEGGTDVALETADVVLLEGGLKKLPHAFEVADQAMRSVRRGLGLVIVPNAIAIGLGALGLINPGVAAIVNNGSTVVAALAGVAPLMTRSRSRPNPAR